MAATHIKAYRQIADVRIAALCNPSGRNLDGDFSRVSGNVGGTDPVKLNMEGVRAYQKVEDFLADDQIDLIDICTPTASHHALAAEALRAGKHVICEKPMARTSRLAREMAIQAEKMKTFLMPAMCMRFWPEWAWLKDCIANNSYGTVLSARFRRVAEPPGWGQQNFLNGELSGGALLDLHIHDVDFVQHCFGKPLALYSTGHTGLSGAVDHVLTQYRVRSGAIVHAEGGWAMTEGFGFSMSYTVNFERATADYESRRAPDALRLFERGKQPQTVTCPGKDGYVGELEYIVQCIEKKEKPLRVTPEDGVIALEICEAEEESIRRGTVVTLAPHCH